MDLEVLERVWWVLAMLAYLQVAVAYTVLARYREHAVTMHDRVRESKLLRRAYQQARGPRREEDDDDEVFESTIVRQSDGGAQRPMQAAA